MHKGFFLAAALLAVPLLACSIHLSRPKGPAVPAVGDLTGISYRAAHTTRDSFRSFSLTLSGDTLLLSGDLWADENTHTVFSGREVPASALEDLGRLIDDLGGPDLLLSQKPPLPEAQDLPTAALTLTFRDGTTLSGDPGGAASRQVEDFFLALVRETDR